MHGLLGNAHEDHERTARRELRFPPILTGLERPGRLAGWRTFGVEGGLLHRLHGGEQGDREKRGDGESEDFQEFHKMIRDVSCDESRNPPHVQ